MGIKDLLENMHLIEDDKEINEVTVMKDEYFDDLPELEENTYTSLQDEILNVETIYTNYNMGDYTNSIFKLNEFLIALKELPKESKVKALTSVLKASGQDIDILVEDGSKRTDLLNNFLKSFRDNSNGQIQSYEVEITELKNKISEFESFIEHEKEKINEQTKIVNIEIDKIKSILNEV